MLFNLAEDPGEVRDLSSDQSYRDVREKLLARVYAEWDPRRAEKRSAEKEIDPGVISAWGKAVGPECTDTLNAPPPELERDVELL